MSKFFGFLKQHKAVKVLLIVFLSVAVAVSGVFIALKIILNNMVTAPEIKDAPDTFTYATLSSIKEEFALTSEEEGMLITDYSELAGFKVYKKAFNKFLNTKDYTVLTDGYTNAGGILVNINNVKKFDGTDFFMHMSSLANSDNMFSSMSNSNAMHYLHLGETEKDNIATVKVLEPKNDEKVKKKTVLTEKNYVYNYGCIPYIVCNYVIRENTVTSSHFSFDEEKNLFKVEMNLDTVLATGNMEKQMYAISGTDVSYIGGSVKYTVYIDSDFVIRSVDVSETYFVTALGIKMSAEGKTTDHFYYLGEENYSPISEEERYDLNDIPSDVEVENDPVSKEVARSAVNNLINDGVNAKLDLSVGDFNVSLDILAKFDNPSFLEVGGNLGEKDFNLYLDIDGSKTSIYLDFAGYKFALNFDDIGEFLTNAIDSFGISFDGIDISAIVTSLDLKDMVSSLGNCYGILNEDNEYIYESSLKDLGIPVDIPLTYKVKDERLKDITINGEMFGLIIDAGITFSGDDIITPEISMEERVDLTDLLSDLFNLDIDLSDVSDIVTEKRLALDVKGAFSGYSFGGVLSVDFSDELKVLANLNFEGIELKVYYEKDSVYISTDNFAIKLLISDIINYVNVFTELPEIETDGLIEGLLDAVDTRYVESNSVNFNISSFVLSLGEEGFSVKGDGLNLTVNMVKVEDEVEKPQAEYAEISGIDDILRQIKKELSSRCFTANLTLNALDTEIILKDVKVYNGGEIDNPTKAFNEGNLSIEGKVLIPSMDISLDVSYVNSVLYVSYNSELNLKFTRSSLDKVVEVVSERIDGLFGGIASLNALKDNEIISSISDYEFTFESVFNMLKALNTKTDEINVEIDASDFGLGSVAIKVYLKDGNLGLDLSSDSLGLSVSLNDDEFDGISVPEGEYKDLSNSSDLLEKVLDIAVDALTDKKVVINIDGKVANFGLNGKLALDFTDEIKVLGNVDFDGIKATVYFEDGIIYLSTDNFAISVSLSEIMDYVKIFTTVPEIDVVETVENALTIIANGTILGDFAEFEVSGFTLGIDLEKISIKGSGIEADVEVVSEEIEVVKPDKEYSRIYAMNGLLGRINDQLNTRYFNFDSISVNIGGTEVLLDDVKVYNGGETDNPTKAFNEGKLTVSGKISVPSMGIVLDVSYVNSTLYVVFNSELKLKLDRSALDDIVAMVLDNYKDIIQRLNYSEILSSTDSITKFKDYEFTLKTVSDMIIAVMGENDVLDLGIDASLFEFGEIYLKAFIDDSDNLALNVLMGDNTVSITMNNDEFDEIGIPEGEFMDLSNITHLLKGAIKSVLKESETYYLSGSAGISVLGIANIKINLNASVRLVDSPDGGKKIEAVVNLSNMDKSIGGSIIEDFIKYGTATLIYKDGYVFVTRTDYTYPFLGIGNLKKGKTYQNKMTKEYFGDNALEQIAFFMGLSENLLKETMNTKHEIKVEKLITSYSGSETKQSIGLSGSELAGSSLLGDIVADIYITDEQLSKLDVVLPISFSIINMNAKVSVEHVMDSLGDFTSITNLNESAYTDITK